MSMPRRLPDGTIFFSIQYSESRRSNELGCVTARLTTSSETSEVYCTVNPRSSLHLSASSLNWVTPVPAIRSVTGSAAWTNGNPVTARMPRARPPVDAAAASIRRRVVPRFCSVMKPSPPVHSADDVHVGIVPLHRNNVALGDRSHIEGSIGQRHGQLLSPIRIEAQLDDRALVFDRGDARRQGGISRIDDGAGADRDKPVRRPSYADPVAAQRDI